MGFNSGFKGLIQILTTLSVTARHWIPILSHMTSTNTPPPPFSLKSMKYSVFHDYIQYAGTAQLLRAVRSGDQISVGARFSAPVQTGPGGHPASYTIGTESCLGVKSGRGVTLTPHPF